MDTASPIETALVVPEVTSLHLAQIAIAKKCISLLLTIVFGLFNLVLIYIPQATVRLLHQQFLVTLSLLLIATIIFVTASSTYLVVRLRYLAKYTKDTTEKSRTPAKSKGFGYIGDLSKKRGTDKTKNYLDEFLSAIKVFGYLERPVFHELTKNMTTQKLMGDEILCLDEEVGFSIVVEGVIQVYTKMDDLSLTSVAPDRDDFDGADTDDVLVLDGQKFHLLNEVKSGASLSSLLSTLDLFHLKQSRPPLRADPVSLKADLLSKLQLRSMDMPHLESIDKKLESRPESPSFNLAPHDDSFPSTPVEGSLTPMPPASTLPEIIARPKQTGGDSIPTATIAIIPKIAFQRVHARFPKATSHIVTMVLTRLYKVTLSTVHNYLGLTKEIMESELLLNRIEDQCKLPGYLVDGVLETFKVHDPAAPGTAVEVLPKVTKKPRAPHREKSSRYVMLTSLSKASHPGDLLSAVPLSRKAEILPQEAQIAINPNASEKTKNRFSLDFGPNTTSLPSGTKLSANQDARNMLFSDEREETEETSLRIAIIENMFKLLGIEDTLEMSEVGFDNVLLSSTSLILGHIGSSARDLNAYSPHKYFYNSLTDSSRGGSSVGLSLENFSQPQKLYNTFHQSSSLASERFAKPAQPDSFHRKSASLSSEMNFASVKNAFSRKIEVKYYAPGTELVAEDAFETGLYYVIHGSLDVSCSRKKEGLDETEPKTTRKLYTVGSGGLAGYLSSVVGYRLLVTITSSKDEGAIVAYISKQDFSKLMDRFYFLQLPVATKLKTILPEMIKTIDFALEWCHIPAGGVLASQGDIANGFHMVLSGRFRVVRDNTKPVENSLMRHQSSIVDDSNLNTTEEAKKDYEILGEYGHGQSIGEAEVLTASRRANSLIAVRDSETARIPRTLFEMLSVQNPAIMVKVSRIVANRVLESSLQGSQIRPVATSNSLSSPPVNGEYKTITILPCVSGLPVREFADKLVGAFKAIGRNVIALDRTSTLTHLGRNAFDERLSHLKLSGYFAYLEEKYETIVYVCDAPLKSNWTSTCISQGDCILLLADAEDDECATNVGDYESLLVKLKTTARTDLCLIHSEKAVIPGSTSIWLKNRIWVQDHHHLQMTILKDHAVKRVRKKNNILYDIALKVSSKANPNIKLKIENVKSRAMESWLKLNDRFNNNQVQPVTNKNDFMRLARILSNEAVGLVLGGGGSRGISHVGVVTALEKHGIPVDIIGGTSIGSFVGGLYAKENNIVSLYGMTKKFSSRVGSFWRNIFDLTYPVTSYITGYEFNRGIWKVFGYHEIEDFWIKYFCNSTNITKSRMEIHERGYAWRFIRASMSLAGLLPPIAYNGSMLLDGGYLDNLPVSEMKNRGAKYIIAVDVGSVDEETPMSYGDSLSGFWVLFNKINPFSKHPNVPSMMDIQLRLAYVASVYALDLAKKTPGVIYLRPPIDDYATLDFLKFDEIYNVGLAYADELLTRWQKEKKFPKIAGVDMSLHHANADRISIQRRNSI